jgi:hypothetical protein
MTNYQSIYMLKIRVFTNYCTVTYYFRIRGSSVGTVSEYGLDDRAIEVRSPAEDFFSDLCVQTGSGAHPASCTMGTGGPFPGGGGLKRGRGATLTTHFIMASPVLWRYPVRISHGLPRLRSRGFPQNHPCYTVK